ncbi:Nostrin [Bagarius yarrelli]|uniref:Osteoclast-stimulating factor 1 n=1 Tax=Bagarius yarrelli TaxID=175774 RepID=A0A556U4M0_BAGYA|nr:Nostrin [Bagarius yarrelli]
MQLENAIEKSRKLVLNNWNEQLKAKKKLNGLTREHEALFSFVEKNKHICTEKEKQKMLNRLSKSAELQVRVDEQYFNINLDSYQIRLKWENTLQNCYQIVQETEKQRILTLSRAVNKYSRLMSSYSQSLLHSGQQIEDAVRRADVEKDIQTLVENTCTTADENKAEFLIVDYFEEEGTIIMDKERRRDALKMKLQRLQECILKTRKEKEGLEKTVGVEPENISYTSEEPPGEREQLLEGYVLKLDILEATYCKLNQSLTALEGKPKPSHRFNDSITKFREKEVEHSIARLPRPIRIKTPPFRSRAESGSVGKCKALYDFSSEKKDELNIKEGDLLDILRKDSSGWWYGELNGKRGHFPYNYVKELPDLKTAKSSDA